MFPTRRWATVLVLFFVVLRAQALGQSSSVGPVFAPVPSIEFANEDVQAKGIVAEPDGRVMIFGGNMAVDGVVKCYVA